MAIALHCRCGNVRGEIDAGRAYARATCYCKDCQAYARWLGGADLTDDRGGTDILAMAPAAVRFTDGEVHVGCMSLSERGLLRWYASCCRTPLGNTPRDARVHYVGMATICLAAAPDALDAVSGPRDRIVLSTASAGGPVGSTPLAFLLGGLRILAGIVGARLRGVRASPFFDEATGTPIQTPEVLSPEARRMLR